MNDSSPAFKIAQTFAITSSIFLSGFAFSASFLSLPALSLAPPSVRLQQWQRIYDLGKLVSPTLSAVSSVAWAHVTYVSYKAAATSGIGGRKGWGMYGVAGLATFAMLPWTVGVMMGTNVELMRRTKDVNDGGGRAEKNGDGKEGVAGEAGEVEKLLERWQGMNYVRAVLPMVGAVVGLWAALS